MWMIGPHAKLMDICMPATVDAATLASYCEFSDKSLLYHVAVDSFVVG